VHQELKKKSVTLALLWEEYVRASALIRIDPPAAHRIDPVS
jgi:hypothetical protein